MQFMPATWKSYGVDGNNDGLMDPYNPVDAIFAAARYLKAAGADKDIRGAVFAYNHADWYVDSVLMRAQLIGGLPSNLVGSLTGLTEGRFPVAANASYKRRGHQAQPQGRPATTVQSHSRVPTRPASRSTPTPARRSSPSATSQVTRIGENERLGKYVQVQDAYGNTYTYGELAKISEQYAAPKPQKVDPAEVKRLLALPKPDAKPKEAASDTDRPASRASAKGAVRADRLGRQPSRRRTPPPTPRDAATAAEPAAVKERLFAHPTRSNAMAAGGAQQEFLRTGRIDGALTPALALGLARDQIVIKKLKVGSQVPAGTVLGRDRLGLLGQEAVRALRDPARPGAAPRGSTRSRSSTAGSCSSRPRSTARRARTRSSARTRRRRRSARSC